MKLKGKKILCSLMIVSLILIPTTTALADNDEAQEKEKLYMLDDVNAESPIKVVIDETEAISQDVYTIDNKYGFEADLSIVNPMYLFEENSGKVTSVLNNHTKRTIVIDKGSYQFINQFVNSYLDTYVTKNMPDMDTYYELSNNARMQNKLSVEAFVFKDAIVKSNIVEDIDYTINISEVTPLSENISEILFYLERTFHTNEGDERGGTWFLTQIANTVDDYKLLNVWIQNYEYEMMQNTFKNKYLSKNIELDKNTIKQDILDEYEKIQDNNSSKLYIESLNEPNDKLGNNLTVQPRKTTLTYDREAVGKAAKQYAYNYNSLFVAQSLDCTNYVSQCMW